jgi:hypothetical protein
MHLLILREKGVAADLKLQGFENVKRLALGRQRLTGLTEMRSPIPKGHPLAEVDDRGQAQDLPFLRLLEQKTREDVHVYALHDHHDRAGPFIVEARQRGVRKTLIRAGPLGFGQDVVRLERIVNNDDVAPTAGKGAPDRSRHPKPALG